METTLLEELGVRFTAPLTPIVRELPADLETPISVYLKLCGKGPSFLLESVTGGEQVARYSFIGVQPSRAYIFRGKTLEMIDLRQGGVIYSHLAEKEDPLVIMERILRR